MLPLDFCKSIIQLWKCTADILYHALNCNLNIKRFFSDGWRWKCDLSVDKKYLYDFTDIHITIKMNFIYAVGYLKKKQNPYFNRIYSVQSHLKLSIKCTAWEGRHVKASCVKLYVLWVWKVNIIHHYWRFDWLLINWNKKQ